MLKNLKRLIVAVLLLTGGSIFVTTYAQNNVAAPLPSIEEQPVLPTNDCLAY